jgi:colicin import membrane protein
MTPPDLLKSLQQLIPQALRTTETVREQAAEIASLRKALAIAHDDNEELRQELDKANDLAKTLRSLNRRNSEADSKQREELQARLKRVTAELEAEKRARQREEQQANQAVAKAEARAEKEAQARRAAEARLLAYQEATEATQQEQAAHHEQELLEERGRTEQAEAERDEALRLASRRRKMVLKRDGTITKLKDVIARKNRRLDDYREQNANLERKLTCPKCRNDVLRCVCCHEEFRLRDSSPPSDG